MIVADTNLIAAFVCKTEASSLALNVRQKDPDWVAPAIWQSELRNTLLGMMRAQRIGIIEANNAFKVAMNTVQTFDVATPAVLRIAEAHQLTAYDAEFAALAEWLECDAVAFDDHLLKPGLAIHPKDF